ncbi:MAG TPA: glycosyltransferase family 39 protein [Chitinophagales bacterium]
MGFSIQKYIGWALVIVLFSINAHTAIMDVDAAQYAEISREMLQSNDWTKVYCLGQDYLDKPPLLFWLSAFSFKLFGISDWSYKLPSILFALLAIYSIYHLAKLMKNEMVAQYSAIIFASCFAINQMTYDVRTDTILCGSVAFASWQIYVWLKNNSWKNAVLSGIGIGLALLAKGPIGAIVPIVFFAFAGFTYKVSLRKNKFVFASEAKQSPRFLGDCFGFSNLAMTILILVVAAILLLPMCIGLYNQYGIHGLKFFFWYQSFGRITGENTWHNNPDPFFLSHTTLWAFAPWTILLVYALIKETKFIITHTSKIAFAYFGFVLSLIALSLSKYQLPHYIFVAYPFLAIICGNYAQEFFANKFFRTLQIIVMILVVVLITFLNFYVMKSDNLILISLCLIFAFVVLFIREKPFAVGASALLLFISLALGFQKKLGEYQTYTFVGKYLHEHNIPKSQFASYNAGFSFALPFYAQEITQTAYDFSQLKSQIGTQKTFYVLVDDSGFKEIKNNFSDAKTCTEPVERIEVVYSHENYPITLLNAKFLNPKMRSSACKKFFLLQIKMVRETRAIE